MAQQPKRWFITGISTGLGRAFAEAALARGDTVAGTVRSAASRAAFEALAPGKALAFCLDVSRGEATVRRVAGEVIDALGHVDVVVNNAGYGAVGALEEVSEEEIRRQFEVNVFGALWVMRAFLPSMRARRAGHIVNVSSQGGVVATPGVGIYNASKFALEGLSEALVKEAGPLGIQVTLLEPGPFRTDWAGRSMAFPTPIAEYGATAGARVQFLRNEADGKQAGDPKRAAALLLELIDLPRPPLRVPMGNTAVDVIRTKLLSQLAEVAEWESRARTLDFD